MKKILAVLFFLLPSVAFAQSSGKTVADCAVGVSPAYSLGSNQVPTINPQGQNCITGTISASLAGFAPATTGTPITATTGGATGTLPAGAVVSVFNTGTTNTAYCKLGASSTTSDIAIQPGSWFAYTVGGATQLTCITSTSTTTVNMVGGSGLPTGAGGGGSGGGGGGAVTQASGSVASGAYSSGAFASGSFASGSMAAGSHATGSGVDGWDLTQGAIADAAVTAGATGSVSAKLRSISRDVMSVNTWAGGTLAAMAAYGTPPSGLVPGVNAFVTNTLAGITMGDGIATGSFPTGSPVFAGLFNGTSYDRPRSGGVTGMQGVSLQASPTGGCTPNTVVTSAASTNAANVKASAGTLCDWSAGNTSSTLYWVHFYNTAGTPTCNTGIIESYPISAAPAVGQVGGWSRPLPQGRAYGTGIGICITANADGTGNAAASAVTLNIGYK